MHSVGGFTGTILIGFFGEGTGLLAGGDWKQLVVQLVIAFVAIPLPAVTAIISRLRSGRPSVGASPKLRKSAASIFADQGERASIFAGTASSVLRRLK